MAVFISRQIKDGEHLVVGTNLAVPRAGVLLAHFHHCPNLRVGMGIYLSNLLGQERVASFEFLADNRMAVGAESLIPLEQQFSVYRKMDLTFIGGLQIDKYGNTNLIGIGDDHGHLKFRGPGSVGTASITALFKRYFLYSSAHNKKVFVEGCDFISSVGWGAGGAQARRDLGLLGGGPQYAISPLAVMDFEEQSKRMRLRYLIPGVTAQEVLDNTGFELLVHPEIETLAEPDDLELEILRTKVDPEGILRS